MVYKLTFLKPALKEWSKLAPPIQKQFKKKLAEILISPHIKNSRVSGIENCYKIKLRSIGYRLVYIVEESEIKVQVISVGRRDKNFVYKKAQDRVN